MIVIYDDPTDKRILPIYSALLVWDSAITGEAEDLFLDFRLLGEESQLTMDGIFRATNGGQRLVGYKATANLYITEGYVATNHTTKILTQKPTRVYIDLRPYQSNDPAYSLRIVDLSEYDASNNRKAATEFSWVAYSEETTQDIYKTNLQISCLYGKDAYAEFIDTF